MQKLSRSPPPSPKPEAKKSTPTTPIIPKPPEPEPIEDGNTFDTPHSDFLKLRLDILLDEALIIKDEAGKDVDRQSIKTFADLKGKTMIGANRDFKMDGDSGLRIEYTRKKGGSKYHYLRYYQNNSYYMTWMEGSASFYGEYTWSKDFPSGTATYKGRAVAKKSDKSDFIKGKFELTVDFDSKKVTGGKIEIPSSGTDAKRTITLKETALLDEVGPRIIGNGEDFCYRWCNQYIGDAEEGGKTGKYRGGFFGENAAETAGKLFFDGNSKHVSFGGRKQP